MSNLPLSWGYEAARSEGNRERADRCVPTDVDLLAPLSYPDATMGFAGRDLRRLASAVFLMALACSVLRAPAHGEGTGPLPDLSGRWAMLQVTSQIGVIPLVGERTRTTWSLVLLDVHQDGLAVRAQESTCSTTIDNGTALVKTEIPEAFLLSLSQMTWTATLEASGEGLRFVRPWVTSVNGARLEDPENEPLPTSAADPRVLDQDGDGKPGLTVRVRVMGLISGEVYVVQRDRSRLSGTVVSPDAVDGLVEWTSEQSVLGASNPFLLGGAAARIDPVPEHSFFRARRIAEATTCADLRETAGILFGY